MLLAALRDLQWRRRRFLIAAIGTALVFAMSLLLSGLSNAFESETAAWIESTRADYFVVKDGQAGPLTGFAPVEISRTAEVAATPGVEQASPFMYVHATTHEGDGFKDVNVFGAEDGGLGWPEVDEGALPSAPGQALVNGGLGFDVGDTMQIGQTEFEVVGIADDSTLNAGIDNVYISLPDAQALFLAGFPGTTIILVRGEPSGNLPAGLTAFDREQAQTDQLRPLSNARQSIDVVRILLWIVAACIIGSIVYLTALERTRDFAVFKAVGASTSALGVGLAVQAVVLAVVSAILATVIGLLLAPVFPLPVDIPLRAMVLLPVVAVVVGLLASLVGLRQAVKVPPAAAFGGP
jgi:putative ABC transport system permease protein